MAMKVNSNQAAEFGQRILGQTKAEGNQILKRIASGLRINQASDDAAGFGISERLRYLSSGYEQAQSNIQDAASALQVAEGGLSAVGDSLQRMRELSVQAANDTLTDADRQALQAEMSQLTAEIDRQTGATQFNGQKLLTGQFAAGGETFDVQIGANEGDTLGVNIPEVSTTTLNVNNLDISTRAGAEAAISSLDSAISNVSGTRATIGANINRLESANTYVGVARENTLSAMSQIRDADMSEQATLLALNKIKTQSGTSALVQANLNTSSALKLLGA